MFVPAYAWSPVGFPNTFFVNVSAPIFLQFSNACDPAPRSFDRLSDILTGLACVGIPDSANA